MKKEDFMKKGEKVWIDDTSKGKSMYEGKVLETGILEPPKTIVGRCYDGSRRVYEMRDAKKFAIIELRMTQDEWKKFRYKDSKVQKGMCFKCINSKNETRIVPLVDDTFFEPLVDTSKGEHIYLIEMKVSFM